ncbi:hypothetical protein KIPB_008935, partial [Kipferlia bialata]
DALRVSRAYMAETKVPREGLMTHWEHESGEVSLTEPRAPCPLNPDHALSPRDSADVSTSTMGQYPTEESVIQGLDRHLLRTLLPQLVDDLDSLEVSPTTPQALTQEMHARGINVCHLGRVAALSALPHISEMAYRGILSRCIKLVLRDAVAVALASHRQRVAEGGEGSTSPSPYAFQGVARSVISQCISAILGEDSAPPSPPSDDTATPPPSPHAEVWDVLASLSASKFGVSLSRGILSKVYLPGCVRDALAGVGTGLTNEADARLQAEAPSTFSLMPCDLLPLRPVCKEVVQGLLPLCSCHSALSRARQAETDALQSMERWDAPSPALGRVGERYTEAEAMCIHTLSDTPGTHLVLQTAMARAQHLKRCHETRGDSHNSHWCRCAGIAPSAESEEAVSLLKGVLAQIEGVQGGASHHRCDSQALVMEAECHLSLADLLFHPPSHGPTPAPGPSSRVAVHLCRAIHCFEQSLGYQHPQTADAYIAYGCYLLDIRQSGQALLLLRRAHEVYAHSLGDSHPLTLGALLHLRRGEMRGGSRERDDMDLE